MEKMVSFQQMFMKSNIIQNKLIRDKCKNKRDMVQEFMNLNKDIFIWDSGNKIILMVKEYLYILMDKGMKDKWIKEEEMVKEHFIIMMEEFIEDHGKMIKKTDMVFNKVYIIMKVNGKMI